METFPVQRKVPGRQGLISSAIFPVVDVEKIWEAGRKRKGLQEKKVVVEGQSGRRRDKHFAFGMKPEMDRRSWVLEIWNSISQGRQFTTSSGALMCATQLVD